MCPAKNGQRREDRRHLQWPDANNLSSRPRRRDLRSSQSLSVLKRRNLRFLHCGRKDIDDINAGIRSPGLIPGMTVGWAAALDQAFGPVAGEYEFEHFGVLIVPAEALDQIQPVDQLKRAQA